MDTERLGQLGLRVLHLVETESTNGVASKAAASGEPGDLLVWADSQTSGRGRQGRGWHSPPGCGLYFSLLRRPEMPARDAYLWTLLTAVAVHGAVHEHCSEAWIKWPNDILVGDQKLAGILCELQTGPGGRVNSLVVGVGINLCPPPTGWPKDLEGRACAVWDGARPGDPSMSSDLLASAVSRFLLLEADLLRGNSAALLQRYRHAMSPMLGRMVLVEEREQRVVARVQGMSDRGALQVVDEGGGQRVLLAGDVHLRPLVPQSN